MQRKSANAAPQKGNVAPPIVHDVLRSSGRPLDGATRAFFEPRFGHDFSRVRVHTGDKAAESAQAVGAFAYTVGTQVVFESGRYAPGTKAGQELLAHELGHVVQQQRTGSSENGLPATLPIGEQDNRSEREAEAWARTIAQDSKSESPEGVRTSAAPVSHQLQRQSSDDNKKEVPALLQAGDYKLDFKPIAPLPIDLPSVEDVHKGLYNLTHKDKPEDISCPPGWVKMADGRCCEGKRDSGGATINLTKCCSPARLTKLGVCCAADETPRDWGCEKVKVPVPPIPKPQGGTSGLHLTLPPATPPLTLDLSIHFNHDQPGSVVASKSALQSSLTQTGEMELASVLSWMHRDPPFSAQLTGMASVEGPAEHNKKLGEFRARSVANVLILSGVSPARIADPPGVAAECAEIGTGIRNCGADKASSPKDPGDRQVVVRVFLPPRKTVVGPQRP